MKTEVHVRALLAEPDGDDWLVDCTMCGTLGVVHGRRNVDRECLQHLEEHGVDTTGVLP